MQVLLARGANIEKADSHGMTPLHTAVEFGKDKAITVC